MMGYNYSDQSLWHFCTLSPRISTINPDLRPTTFITNCNPLPVHMLPWRRASWSWGNISKRGVQSIDQTGTPCPRIFHVFYVLMGSCHVWSLFWWWSMIIVIIGGVLLFPVILRDYHVSVKYINQIGLSPYFNLTEKLIHKEWAVLSYWCSWEHPILPLAAGDLLLEASFALSLMRNLRCSHVCPHGLLWRHVTVIVTSSHVFGLWMPLLGFAPPTF